MLPTVLDSVIDYERDAQAGIPGYVQHYSDRAMLAGRLESVIDDVLARARGAPHDAHHIMTMAGVVAYYLSAPTAASAFARPISKRMRTTQLRPLIEPILAMLRAWRAAKRLRARLSGEPAERTGQQP